jgi:hypothetical protein
MLRKMKQQIGSDAFIARAETWPEELSMASACSGSGSTELIVTTLMRELSNDSDLSKTFTVSPRKCIVVGLFVL